jgi:hypothetical protein
MAGGFMVALLHSKTIDSRRRTDENGREYDNLRGYMWFLASVTYVYKFAFALAFFRTMYSIAKRSIQIVDFNETVFMGNMMN